MKSSRNRLDHDHAPLLSRRFILTAVLILTTLFLANLFFLTRSSSLALLGQEWLPSVSKDGKRQHVGSHIWQKSREPSAHIEVDDMHPIRELMREADIEYEEGEIGRSTKFSVAVEEYRRRYWRHPPPGFDKWYKFARRKGVHDIDDFKQIYDDLRPFWAVPPEDIRRFAAHASDDPQHGLATVHLRDGQVFQETWGWRSETFIEMLKSVSEWLPDMDIPINRMDQPRVVVKWEQMQEMLGLEERTRSLREEGLRDEFTKSMDGFWKPNPEIPEPAWLQRWNPFIYRPDHRNDPNDPHPIYGWFNHANKQLMDIASLACPTDSYARNPDSNSHKSDAEASFTKPLGSFITNANLTSDLCTVGPSISSIHGLLYASTSMMISHTLLPVFSECKTSVNNDILFPANMYYKSDPRYIYNDEQDIDWDDKNDIMPWRGVTSGGTAYAANPEGWQNMQRQRLVSLTNSTLLETDETTLPILTLLPSHFSPQNTYEPAPHFPPALFASNHTDIAFTNTLACVPNCAFYHTTYTLAPKIPFAETFRSKYLIDVDGHSFSGRWRAFLLSRSLPIKATIFREWHDSRLRAWRDYVPLSQAYTELYSLLTYFIGLAPTKAKLSEDGSTEEVLQVERHDYEAFRLAQQGRERAGKVLRTADMEVYLYRLLLEYGRLIDDHRDTIGYVGDGGEEMERFDEEVPAMP